MVRQRKIDAPSGDTEGTSGVRSGAVRIRDSQERVRNEAKVCAVATVMVDAIRASSEVYKYPRLVAAFRLAGLLPEEEALTPSDPESVIDSEVG